MKYRRCTGNTNNQERFKSKALTTSILILTLLVFSVINLSPPDVWSATSFVAPGATWKYLDDGSDQGTAWRTPAFNDAAWQAGPAELGYGDGDEATVVSYGIDPNNKYITTYFRHSFNVINAASFNSLTLRTLRDDGAIVYLNGTEIFRTNMPAGTITYTTQASSAVGGADEAVFYEICLDTGLLLEGMNVLAVEIHQVSGASSDISFNLELIGHTALDTPAVTRGPYLQTGTPTSIIVRWRTDICSDSRVSYGPAPNNLTTIVDDTTVTMEHEVPITGLSPDTNYYYSIGTTTGPLAGGDNDHFFKTSPLTGTANPTRIWVIGDSGTADANAQAVRDAYLSFTGTTATDAWLMLGDNAYPWGTDDEYQAAVFDMYPMLLRNTVVWPTFGNHDAGNASSLDQTGPYYDSFTLPKLAEAGGLASGTEAYYSFDYGNIHFISLDSQDSDRSPTGPMMTWLQNDLAATNQDWIIAFWHHPPYSKGSHDSDNPLDSGGRLFDMREDALPILEAGGVDLVLTGHSHSYERSFLIDGHYGTSNTLTGNMVIDSGDGRVDGTGVYSKPAFGQGANTGTVYSVVGSSGKISGGSLNHPVMFISLNILGSMVLDVNGGQLDASFIDSNGTIQDYFTIVKEAPICDIQMSQAIYTTGDTVTADVFSIANPVATPVSAEWKVWLGIPSIPPISMINIGSDGSFVLPDGFNLDLGPMGLFPAAGMPLGQYELSCRVLDPVTGELFSEDLNPFEIQ